MTQGAPKGNSFWKLRAKHGRDKIFATPEDLWVACCEYFQEIDENPMQSQKLISTKFGVERKTVYHPRPMTIGGLSTFLGVVATTWKQYRKHKDYAPICEAVQQIMYEQNLSGAMTGMLNAAIVARHLGLADKKENTVTGKDGGPVETVVMDKDQYAETRRKMLEEDDC